MIDEFLLAPGPTQVPERVRLAMARALIHHRTPGFSEIFRRAQSGLQWVFGTSEPVLMVTSSGTGGFESAMINFTRREDTIICVGGGKFGERWAGVGRAYGMNVIECPVEWGSALDPDALADLLREHSDCAMVTLSLSETSTGVWHPIERIAEVVRAHGRALLAVDGITAVGVAPVPMDELGIDLLVSGSQKAFALPPGLAFVAASERAWERAASADHPRYYFDLRRERKKQAAGQTAFTPAISLVVGLDEILTMMREEGLEQIHERHDRTARAVRAGLEAMGLELFAEVPSNSVSSARLPEGVDSPAVCKRIRDHYGVTIAGGQDQLKPFLIRIGHLGFISRHSVALGLAALESSLLDCGHTLDRGAGVAAAQRILGDQPASSAAAAARTP